MKYLTDQLQLVFVFALATPNSYILFLHCNFPTCYTRSYSPSLRLQFILKNASLLALYCISVPPPTVPIH